MNCHIDFIQLRFIQLLRSARDGKGLVIGLSNKFFMLCSDENFLAIQLEICTVNAKRESLCIIYPYLFGYHFGNQGFYECCCSFSVGAPWIYFLKIIILFLPTWTEVILEGVLKVSNTFISKIAMNRIVRTSISKNSSKLKHDKISQKYV